MVDGELYQTLELQCIEPKDGTAQAEVAVSGGSLEHGISWWQWLALGAVAAGALFAVWRRRSAN
jgi:hypothetical protein